MAAETRPSHTTTRRIWTALGLQLHRSEMFKLSTYPLFVDKVQDIVGLYLSPPNRAIILGVNEKSEFTALDREQPVLPMTPGIAERRTHTYIRNGTTSLFAALDIATGAVIGQCYKRHRATEFLDFLKQFDRHMPEGSDVYIVMDNYATHKTPKIKIWLAHRLHWHVHFTPISASWINPTLGHVNMPRRAAGETLVRRADPQTVTMWRASLGGRTGKGYPNVHQRAQ